MIKRPKVTTLIEATPIHKIHCGECNWEQLITSETNEELKCCPWCGWSDLEVSKASKTGGHQIIECEKHGKINVVIPSENIESDDFMDNLFCPFCE